MDDPLVPITIGVCLLGLASYQYYRHSSTYWQRRGLKGEPTTFFLREFINIFLRDRTQMAIERTRKYGKVHGFFLMGKPRVVLADAQVLRQVCIKDFDKFQNHSVNEWANKFQRNFLVWLKGDHWKRVRAMMSPQFTSGKIKRMYKLMDGCAEDLLENFREQMIAARRNGQFTALVDLFAIYSLYTMDGITTCCYGLKLERARGDTDIKQAAGRNVFIRDCSHVFKTNIWRLLLLVLVPHWILRRVGFYMVSESSMEPIVKRVDKLIEMRRKGGERTKYDDFLQMLIDAKLDDTMELNEMDQAENHHAGLTHESLLEDQARLKSSLNGKEKSQSNGNKQMTGLSDLEVLSEALFLLAAGLDTTRSSMSTITYLLAHNPDVQDRLYGELKKIAQYEETPVGKHLKFDYDALTSCQYLDAVISESLRFFGPVIYTDRQLQEDYYVEKYNVTLRKDEQVLLGISSVANDPDYWDEPERFNPERFMPGHKENIVPGSYVPFSMGPRHCIGMRFSLTETKLGLAKVLMNYKFSPAPNTKYPPEASFGLSLVSIRNCKTLVNYRDESDY